LLVASSLSVLCVLSLLLRAPHVIQEPPYKYYSDVYIHTRYSIAYLRASLAFHTRKMSTASIPQHRSAHHEFDDDCKECLRANLKWEKAGRERTEAGRDLAAQELIRFSTLAMYAKRNLKVPNETASSPHCHTNHIPAKKMGGLEIPVIDLGTNFWDHRVSDSLPSSFDSETGVNSTATILVFEIIRALGLKGAVEPVQKTPMMDTTPDISLRLISNKLVASTIEGKRNPGEKLRDPKCLGVTPKLQAKCSSNSSWSRPTSVQRKSVS
jgi:hypothetical protein